jgi:hypothetical protein
MRFSLVCLIPLVTLAACAGAPVANAPRAADPAAVVADGAPAAARAAASAARVDAMVRLLPPKGYAVQTAPTVHRWVAADILEYTVKLAFETGPGTYDDAHAVTVDVPVAGPAPKTQAVFTNIPWGGKYRAFVTAKGNRGGVINGTIDASVLTPLNATPATADFDFTAANDVQPVASQTVQVVFDDVPFSGTANVTFQSPADGAYATPAPAISASAE